MYLQNYHVPAISIAAGLAVIGVLSYGTDIGDQNSQLPQQMVLAPRVVSSVSNCAECHQEVCNDFADAPHQRTLIRATDRRMLDRFSGRQFRFEPDGPTVQFETQDSHLWMKSDAYPGPVRVDWVFGSGQNAQTPVSLLTNADGQSELFELSVSWYPPDILGPTPGSENATHGGMQSVGLHLDHHKTRDCFGCHVTQLPHTAGQINQHEIMAGVTCDRCHPGGHDHMHAVEDGVLSIEKWSELSPLESVGRCGECHRRADQLTAAELSPQRKELARFAAVGLPMSRCFQEQEEMNSTSSSVRMDCVTCHNPHRRAEKDSSHYTAKCVNCHSPERSLASRCSSALTSDECLKCHMPKVEVTPHLQLTDHWIRVRSESDPKTVTD